MIVTVGQYTFTDNDIIDISSFSQAMSNGAVTTAEITIDLIGTDLFVAVPSIVGSPVTVDGWPFTVKTCASAANITTLTAIGVNDFGSMSSHTYALDNSHAGYSAEAFINQAVGEIPSGYPSGFWYRPANVTTGKCTGGGWLAEWDLEWDLDPSKPTAGQDMPVTFTANLHSTAYGLLEPTSPGSALMRNYVFPLVLDSQVVFSDGMSPASLMPEPQDDSSTAIYNKVAIGYKNVSSTTLATTLRHTGALEDVAYLSKLLCEWTVKSPESGWNRKTQISVSGKYKLSGTGYQLPIAGPAYRQEKSTWNDPILAQTITLLYGEARPTYTGEDCSNWLKMHGRGLAISRAGLYCPEMVADVAAVAGVTLTESDVINVSALDSLYEYGGIKIALKSPWGDNDQTWGSGSIEIDGSLLGSGINCQPFTWLWSDDGQYQQQTHPANWDYYITAYKPFMSMLRAWCNDIGTALHYWGNSAGACPVTTRPLANGTRPLPYSATQSFTTVGECIWTYAQGYQSDMVKIADTGTIWDLQYIPNRRVQPVAGRVQYRVAVPYNVGKDLRLGATILLDCAQIWSHQQKAVIVGQAVDWRSNKIDLTVVIQATNTLATPHKPRSQSAPFTLQNFSAAESAGG